MAKLKLAANETEQRAILKNYKRNRYAPSNVITQNKSNLLGLVSEYAASVYFNIDFDFDAIYSVGRSDLSNGHEVRSTTHQNGNLITYDRDKPACYILAVVDLEQSAVDLKGWLHINECRQPKYWRDIPEVREASYWTPQRDLRPLHELLGNQ
jgi:hypothetical protein